MKLIRSIGGWFSNGGNIILAKIAYYFYWVYTFLQAAGLIVFYILLTDALIYAIEVWLCVLLILVSVPIVTFINLVILGLIYGYIDWLENVQSVTLKVNKLKKVVDAQNKTQEPVKEQTKENAVSINKVEHEIAIQKRQKQEEKRVEIKKLENPSVENQVVFKDYYVGIDSNGSIVRVLHGTTGTIVTVKSNSKGNIKIKQADKEVIVTNVPTNYLSE